MKRIAGLILLLSVSLFARAQQGAAALELTIKKYTDQIAKAQSSQAVSTLYLQRGLTYFQARDFSKAAEDFKKYIEKRPDNRYLTSALYNQALCQEQLNEWRGAVITIDELLEELGKQEMIDGKVTWNDVLSLRIQILKKQGYWYVVVNDLKKVPSDKNKTLSDSILSHNSLLSALQSNNVYTILKIENSRRVSNSQKYLEQGELDAAILVITEEVNGMTPENKSTPQLIRGYLYAAMNNLKEAQNDFDAVAQQSLNLNVRGLANFYGSFVKEQLGDIPGAQASIQQSEKIFTSEKSIIPSSQVTKQMKVLSLKPYVVTQSTGLPGNVSVLKQESNLANNSKKEEPVKKNPTPIQKNQDDKKKTVETEVAKNTKVLTGSELEIFNLSQRMVKEPENTGLHFQRGMAFFQSNQFSPALVDFTNFRKFSADNYKGQAEVYRAKCFEKLNQPDKAIGVYSDLLKSQNDVDLLSLKLNRKDLLLLRANLYVKNQNLLGALNDYQKVNALEPQYKDSKTKADSIFSLDPLYKVITYDVFTYVAGSLSKKLIESEQAFRNGDLELSKTLASEEIGKIAVAPMIRGFVNMAAKNYGLASVDFKNALQANLSFEQKALVNFYQSFVFQKLDNSDEAINSISETMKVFTSDKSMLPNSMLLLQRADLFEKQGFKDMAVKDYDLYLIQRPGDSKVRQKREAIAGNIKVTPVETLQPQVVSQVPKVKEEPPVEKKPTLRDLFANEKRYALIIGNSDYPPEIGRLINPANDAEDLKTELEKSDFEVVLLKNVSFRQIDVAAANFYKKLNDGPKDQTVGLFYYSGHGIQYEGQNYIVPTDAQVTVPEDIRYVCYPADRILGRMEFANTRMNIIIIDACRSNPFPIASRAIAPGLAQSSAAKGSYIAFATAPGSTASDGTGRNGLYTQELLKSIRKPGQSIEQVFKEVRLNVSRLSDGKQNTWDNSNIVGDFYFRFDN